MGSGASGNRALVVPRAFESALRGGGRNGFLGCWSVPHASITLAMAPSAGSGLEARPSRPNFINFAGQKASPGRSKRPSAFGSGPLLKHTSRTRRSVLGCPNALPASARRLPGPALRRRMRWGCFFGVVKGKHYPWKEPPRRPAAVGGASPGAARERIRATGERQHTHNTRGH